MYNAYVAAYVSLCCYILQMCLRAEERAVDNKYETFPSSQCYSTTCRQEAIFYILQ